METPFHSARRTGRRAFTRFAVPCAAPVVA